MLPAVETALRRLRVPESPRMSDRRFPELVRQVLEAKANHSLAGLRVRAEGTRYGVPSRSRARLVEAVLQEA